MDQGLQPSAATGVNESYFYMWRAIFALAHADGKIDKQEEAFMDEQLKTQPFSLRQKAVLEDDIIHPKDPGAMLSKVSDPMDQGMFFQFARMMCWSDGNYDIQEKEIMDRLLGAHMGELDVDGLTKALHGSREKIVADDTICQSVGSILIELFSKAKKKTQALVSDSRFYMWRAIFALAHADDVVTEEERHFMLNTLGNENFTAEQQSVLERDMIEAQDITKMFMGIGDQEDRSQFFYFARMLCWSDGNFDKQEQEIILKLNSIHVRNVNVDEMIGNIDMQIDDDHRQMLKEDMDEGGNPLQKFLKRFKS